MSQKNKLWSVHTVGSSVVSKNHTWSFVTWLWLPLTLSICCSLCLERPLPPVESFSTFRLPALPLPQTRGAPTVLLATWISLLILLLQFSRSVMSYSLQPHGLQHPRPPCPSPTPGVYSNWCPWSRWCYLTISFYVVLFSSWPQLFPASLSFPVSCLFASGGQSIGASASKSVLSMNIQDWFPLGLTSLISLQFKWLSRVFSNTTVQKHQLKTPSKVCLGSLYILVK